jgi:hypothetical protein
LLITRNYAVAAPLHLPDASWAVFLLAGAYVRTKWFFPGLCVLAAVIDWIAIAWGGVSGFCVTPAYAMLLPAYASLWLGGRWIARMPHRVTFAWLRRISIVLTAAVLAECFSAGGFYIFGGRIDAPTLDGFMHSLVTYFPATLGSLALYLIIAVFTHGVLAIVHAGKDYRAQA